MFGNITHGHYPILFKYDLLFKKAVIFNFESLFYIHFQALFYFKLYIVQILPKFKNIINTATGKI